MCRTLRTNRNGLPNGQGKVTWDFLGLNGVLEQYLTRNPPIDDWTGRLYRDELAISPASGFSCLGENDNCVVATDCGSYDQSTGPWISIALHNFWRLTRAQIKGYDRAIETWDRNNQQLAKAVFTTAFGRNRKEFDVGAFFQGFFTGVSLVMPVLRAGGSFALALRGTLQAGAKQATRSNIRLLLADDPTADGRPFVQSLREAYAPMQADLRAILRGFMDTGITDLFFNPTVRQTVAFLQNGDLLNAITQTDDELIQEAADSIIRQTAANIIADIWSKQGLTLGLLANSQCSDTNICAVDPDGCSEFRFFASDVRPQRCLQIGAGFEFNSDLPFLLRQLKLDFQDISKNAFVCPRPGVFPPQETNIIDFGLPQCAFPLRHD
ncbi:hypothetical protein PV10_06745 [Exophiala mesophila]|uniref:Uncharacterized protein n=1 Tax=Exophiala mesophila TaxID=212818 RepID=A0A0D1ZZP1_EXOME|nr:uncharacterized protein PV10_06745 [Exophiala mesophila]KIV92293.1 hypothetical protein PV10_06745 [Exophiala mesophila]